MLIAIVVERRRVRNILLVAKEYRDADLTIKYGRAQTGIEKRHFVIPHLAIGERSGSIAGRALAIPQVQIHPTEQTLAQIDADAFTLLRGIAKKRGPHRAVRPNRNIGEFDRSVIQGERVDRIAEVGNASSIEGSLLVPNLSGDIDLVGWLVADRAANLLEIRIKVSVHILVSFRQDE